jgi:hypothetical protein
MQRRKKIFSSVLLLVALCFAASLVYAGNPNGNAYKHSQQNGKGPNSKHFSARGEVLAINPVDLTMTVELQKANRILKEYLDTSFDFKISKNVRVKLEGADPGVFDLSLADVDLGDTVRVLGWYNGTDFVIYQIVILQD